MIEYVAGFLIHKSLNLVAVVRKLKPDWQAGLFNGIGGSIEELCTCGHVKGAHKQHEIPGGMSACTECWKNRAMRPSLCHVYGFRDMELPYTAMCREFYEETGTAYVNWNLFCTLQGETRRSGPPFAQYKVYFFRGFAQTLQTLTGLKTTTQEAIMMESISNINASNSIPNLPWLLRAALDIDHDIAERYEIVERYA